MSATHSSNSDAQSNWTLPLANTSLSFKILIYTKLKLNYVAIGFFLNTTESRAAQVNINFLQIFGYHKISLPVK
jgi:hypothetical protein